ncbi:MAG: endonuclease/exonuclease/phosphatase family protein [Lachnospiraceae bacterium]|nr:endonuclease/exonuclease/phosphatase family protein [Lachnospiraceae bacterium]
MNRLIRNISRLVVSALVLVSVSACGQRTAHSEETQTEAIQTEPTSPEPDTLTAMSFNVYAGKQTEQRRMSVLQTILRYLPDTVGVQEATPEWMDYLKENLGELYGFVGTGREGGEKGEHCAILYRKERFELVETDTKWLSDTPNEVSKYEESSYIRIFTYAVLTDRETGSELVVVNTHLDNGSSVAREKQLAVLLNHLERFSETPLILTGDFNCRRGRGVYKTVTEVLTDSFEIALEKKDMATYMGSSMGVIDYVFVSSHISEVLDYRVIAVPENGMIPSDHLPVLIEYSVR